MARFRVERVQRMVEDDFCSHADFENPWHGIEPEDVLDGFLRPPRSMRFIRLTEVGFVWLWAVFDERPGEPGGYLVVFDPRRGEYGLATKPHGRRYGRFLGFFGTRICDVIRAM
jgi:hypothetical protein